MKRFYNKKTVIEYLQENTGYSPSYPTIINYENRGWLKPAGKLDYGKNQIPIYDEESLKDLVETLDEMKKQGKVKIRVNE